MQLATCVFFCLIELLKLPIETYSCNDKTNAIYNSVKRPNCIGFGGEVVSALAFLNATRTQTSCEKSKSQRSAESRGFSPGTPVSSHRESRQGGLGT
jgi:hypothetical protein